MKGTEQELPPAPVPTGTGWPELRSAQEVAAEECDGVNPSTNALCVLGYHKGHHRDAAGAEWLDR